MRVLTCSLACVLAAAAVCDAAQLLEFVPLDALQAALNAGKPIVFATPGRPESEASIPVCTLPDGSPRWVPGIPKGDAHTISVTLSLLGLKQKKIQTKVKAGDFEVHPLLAAGIFGCWPLVFLAASVLVSQAMMTIPEIITPCPIAEPASKVAGFEPHVPATVAIDRERVENL